MVRESVNNLGGLTSQLKLIGSRGTKGGDKNTTVCFTFWRVSRGQNAIFSNIVVHLDMFCSAKLGGKPQEAIQVVAFFSKGFFCGRKLLLLLCLSSVQYDVQFWGQNEEEERFSSSVSSLEFISMSTRLDRLV